MSDERWIKAYRGPDGMRYHNDAAEYGRLMYERWRSAESQRVETIRWCETHGQRALPGAIACEGAYFGFEARRCVLVTATLILPPRSS